MCLYVSNILKWYIYWLCVGRFVEKYTELQSTGEFEEDVLFEETSKALLAEGILLRRKGGPTVSSPLLVL